MRFRVFNLGLKGLAAADLIRSRPTTAPFASNNGGAVDETTKQLFAAEANDDLGTFLFLVDHPSLVISDGGSAA